MCVVMLVRWSMCGGRRSTDRSSLSTLWILGAKFGSLGMVAGVFYPLSHLGLFFSA